MDFLSGQPYHVFNQGNNRQQIFFDDGNYQYFLKRAANQLPSVCSVVAYCLMPNHFHFLIVPNEEDGISLKVSRKFQVLLSSYSQALNRQKGRSGSLFRQKTKAKKLLSAKDVHYDQICFHYIHQNPLRAGLVNKLEEWPYSSFNCYLTGKEDLLCDADEGRRLFELSEVDFYATSYAQLPELYLSRLRF